MIEGLTRFTPSKRIPLADVVILLEGTLPREHRRSSFDGVTDGLEITLNESHSGILTRVYGNDDGAQVYGNDV